MDTLLATVSKVPSAEYSVVDLPLPVGPVTSTMPYGWSMTPWKSASIFGRKPSFSRPSLAVETSTMRMTIFSPNLPGSVLTRRSMGLPLTRTEISPSCGMRRSEMSRWDMILMRLEMAACMRYGGVILWKSTPAMR